MTLDDFDYDVGYNRFDVRHTFNVSALYSLPFGSGRKWLSNAGGVEQALLGGWDVGAIVNGRSGLPLDVRVTRNDVVYRDAAGNVVGGPCATLHGAHQHARRRRLARRAAAEPGSGRGPVSEERPAVAEPGGVRDSGAGRVRQPEARRRSAARVRTRWTSWSRSGSASAGTGATSSSAARCSTSSTANNYDVPPATLPNALGTGNEPAAAGSAVHAGRRGLDLRQARSTVGTTVGMGTNRQAQFALRVNF